MATRRIQKVLIANRGEIAVRIIRTCKEMGIATVAVYSDADRTMPHVYMADEAYRIGPPPSRESYLVMDRIIETAQKANVDAIHPGYGFLSENEEFAQGVADAGLIFVGPTAATIRAMGDKTEARKLAIAAGVPVVPGTEEPLESEAQARTISLQLGFPVLIKAAGGGGGKGMRIVNSEKDLPGLLSQARSEAKSSFGDERVYIEKYLERPRHIEFQILADHHGNIVHLGERECSIQRRHQKVVEESPSVIVDDDLRARMGETAVRVARACNYRNAATVEFLVDGKRDFYFLEMNTRLQVEHPVTEMRTGIDLVAQQLRVAMGEELQLKQEDIQFRGHAIECRIYAEDGENNFMPSTGTITHLRPSQGLGIRDDRGVEEGGEVSVYYDPLITKLIAWGMDRLGAINRMRRALREYEILGVRTNIPVNLFVMEHPTFVEGDFDTNFLGQRLNPNALGSPSAEELDAAAIVVCLLHQNAKKIPDNPSNGTGLTFGNHRVTRNLSKDHVSTTTWKMGRLQGHRD